jgi:hypothetical protein
VAVAGHQRREFSHGADCATRRNDRAYTERSIE